ncbi:MAG: MoaD/ThiS family protein [Gammaproteobacteria bacterium]|nr:MoaD/ThiS family protein [Gammaproteobacteria bacterium]
MIEIEYIGRLKEDLDLEQEQMEWQTSMTDVAALIEHLCRERGSQWSTTLHQENLLVSVNQSMVKTDYPLGDDDKVIFFPPIAGG